ncbi:hypothetical protein ABZV64_01355 [Streptomyces sp. NPDC004959]|uniref:hypothetical protein n=1 Tax=Streptomyces sp. NPDC004959 TaxID=3154673 RepID=UPI0033ACFC80
MSATAAAAWTGSGFVSGTEDRTGLTQLGARAYGGGVAAGAFGKAGGGGTFRGALKASPVTVSIR